MVFFHQFHFFIFDGGILLLLSFLLDCIKDKEHNLQFSNILAFIKVYFEKNA